MQRKHRGMSSIGWLFVLGAGGIFIMCGVKMIPVYVDNMYVEEALTFIIDTSPNLQGLEKSEIKTKLSKYTAVNGIGEVESKSFKVGRYDGRLIVTSEYEKRVPIIHNIDAVMTFKKQLDVTKPDLCCDYLVEIPNSEKK